MKTLPLPNWKATALVVCVLVIVGRPLTVHAMTTVFFNLDQGTNLIASGTTSDTIGSAGYVFTVARDKLFTGGVGLTNPIGRMIRVPWPVGLEAQAVTAGPNPSGAGIEIKRLDGQPFAISTFTAKLLANTAGAGAAIEVMPLLHGEDGFPDPAMYNATGYYGNSFTYNTPELTGFDAYKFKLYVDFALTSLTVVDASLPPPSMSVIRVNPLSVQISWPTAAVGYALESTASLSAPVWSRVTNNVVVAGDVFTVELPASDSQRFFRLAK